MLEREFRAADRDLVVAETDFADDETDIGFPESGIVGLKLFAEHVPEAIDDFGRNAAFAFRNLPFEALDRIVQRGHVRAMLSETLGDGGIARRHEAGFDQLQELSNGGFSTSSFGASLLEIVCTTLIGFVRSLDHMAQQLAETGRFENALFQRFEHDIVELLFTNGLAGATARGPIDLGAAGIIAVLAALAGADRQPATAGGIVANGKAREQGRAVGDTRRRLCRRGLGADRGDGLGFLGLDNLGTSDPDPVFRPGDAAVIIGRLVRVGTAVVGARQNAVQRAMEEWLAAHLVAVGGQIFRDGPGSHRLAAEAMARQGIDTTNDSGLMLYDRKFLAFLIAFHSSGFGLVAVGHGAAVPIAGARVGSTITPRE